ncbi:nuclear transport factor 2 family protein [Ramlibacter sp.]|uniref:nuclear transport factor 2 family protein n=1 Tax=Ramlibacter sp. TaxID=1917967 RepID=UPI003D12B1E3
MNTNDIVELESRRRAGMLQRDVAALSELYHPELLWIHSSGRRESREQVLEGARAGTTRYEKIDATSQVVRLFGDCAVVNGDVDIDAVVGGRALQLHLRFTAVWVATAQGWKFASWQSTPIRDPA